MLETAELEMAGGPHSRILQTSTPQTPTSSAVCKPVLAFLLGTKQQVCIGKAATDH